VCVCVCVYVRENVCACGQQAHKVVLALECANPHLHTITRGGGLGSRPKKMYGERLGDGVEYHLMSPTPRR